MPVTSTAKPEIIVAYPEGHVDISMVIHSGLKGPQALGETYTTLREIEKRMFPVIVINKGSADHERLLTSDGVFHIVVGITTRQQLTSES
jgi:hypothetical protein